MSAFDDKIEELIGLSKPRIAFGIAEKDREVLASLRQGKKYADITLVGPQKVVERIRGFTTVAARNPEKKLVMMLANDEVDGIIRGTIDEFKAYEVYRKLTGEETTIGPGLLEDTKGRQFFLSPVSNPEGWAKEERFDIASGIAEFMSEWGLKAKIAVLTGVRHDTYKRRKSWKDDVQKMLNKTYKDAEWIVAKLKKQGYDATNWVIELNTAIEVGCNVIIPVNGMVGNQIFRAIFVCGGRVLAVPRIGLSRCYEENSRTETDYEPHVRWLVAWINSKKVKKKPSDCVSLGVGDECHPGPDPGSSGTRSPLLSPRVLQQ